MTDKEFCDSTSRFLRDKEPFFFIVDFEKTKMLACSFQEAYKGGILFDINGVKNYKKSDVLSKAVLEKLDVEPYSFKDYLYGFEEVVGHLRCGNSFLVNLTFPSKIKTKLDLPTVFGKSKANYKVLFKDGFVCFSPECFVKIKKDHIYSYPMKGTIDASLKNAETLLLNDPKEEQEHNTIVDLIRNDLSLISKEVTVTKFRYLDKIKSDKGEIFQTSTEIRGKLPENWKENFGELLLKMLPAGSISGAPKPKTVEIIKNAEKYKRGFYTGVFGVFDGTTIDSGVAIRFIEKKNKEYWYKSGGGITHQSNVKEEYLELLRKIYIPTI